MNKEDFWKSLSGPSSGDCDNCKHWFEFGCNAIHYDPRQNCSSHFWWSENRNAFPAPKRSTVSRWVWDGKNE